MGCTAPLPRRGEPLTPEDTSRPSLAGMAWRYLFPAGTVGFLGALSQVVLARHGGTPPQDAVAVVVLLVLGSALTTELLGIHAVFGAFLAGAVLPRDPAIRRALTDRFEDVMVVLLPPLFFAVTGLTARIGLIAGAAWLLSLGVLMNTRGLMERVRRTASVPA